MSNFALNRSFQPGQDKDFAIITKLINFLFLQAERLEFFNTFQVQGPVNPHSTFLIYAYTQTFFEYLIPG